MTVVSTSQEEILWIDAGSEQLFAIHTAPPNDPLGIGIVLLSGGGWIPSTQRNRMYVELARRLAECGYDVLRFDYRGVGESTGETRMFDLMTPHTPEVLAAVDALRSRGVSGIGLVGTCYGGRMALHAAGSVEDLRVMAISCIPVEDYPGASESIIWHGRQAMSRDVWRRLRKKWPKYVRVIRAKLKSVARRFARLAVRTPDTKSRPEYVSQIANALERGVPMLVMHGRKDNHFPQFEAALRSGLGEVLEQHGDLAKLELWDGELHAERTLAAQRYTIEQLYSFLADWAEQARARTRGV